MRTPIGMDTRRLRAFVEIVDRRSITAAAEALSIAQPALSLQVRALESAFGAQLLTRSWQGITPTEAGRSLYHHAKVILKQYASAREEILAATRETTGTVRIGLPAGINNLLGDKLVEFARERHPGVTLVISEGLTGDLIDDLARRHKLDLALVSGEVGDKRLEFMPVVAERIVYAYGESQGDNDDEPIPLRELENVPLILPSSSTQLRRVIQTGFDRAGIAPRIVAEIDSTYALCRAAAEGVGGALLPASTADASKQVLRLRAISDPVLELVMWLAIIRNQPLGREVILIGDLIVEVASALAISGAWRGARPLATNDVTHGKGTGNSTHAVVDSTPRAFGQ